MVKTTLKARRRSSIREARRRRTENANACDDANRMNSYLPHLYHDAPPSSTGFLRLLLGHFSLAAYSGIAIAVRGVQDSSQRTRLVAWLERRLCHVSHGHYVAASMHAEDASGTTIHWPSSSSPQLGHHPASACSNTVDPTDWPQRSQSNTASMR